MKFRRLVKILVFPVLLSGVSCSSPEPTDTVAKVAGETITVKDLIQAIYREGEKFGDKNFQSSERFEEVKRRFLQDLIQKKILVHEANSEGIKVSDEELEQELRNYKSRYTEKDFQAILEKRKIDYSTWREIKKANWVISRLLKEKVFASIEISDEKTKSYYQDHLKDFRQPEMVRIRQILTDTKEKAQEILKKLNAGENFAKLAHDYSLSPDRANGGDLGYIRRGSFPKEFEISFDLEEGELSPVVSSLYGFHIFKVLDKKPEMQMTYEEAKPQIEELLRSREEEELFKKYYQELQKKYPVEINQSVLKKVVL